MVILPFDLNVLLNLCCFLVNEEIIFPVSRGNVVKPLLWCHVGGEPVDCDKFLRT